MIFFLKKRVIIKKKIGTGYFIITALLYQPSILRHPCYNGIKY